MKKPKYTFTPEQDQLIVQTYREIQPVAGHTPVIRQLAQRFNVPPWMLSRRARDIGAYEPRIKEPVWFEKEISLLERNAHKHPEVIRRHFAKAGFKRSTIAIILKRKKLRLVKNLNGQSASQLAQCFGIDVHAISNWIKKGLLNAQTRGTERTEQQGGDIYYIKEKDIRQFIIENIGLIDLRKVDKFWFIDVMKG